MNRLTHNTRWKILRAVREDTFKARRAKLKEREHVLAIRVRDHVLGKHKKTVLSLPKDLLPETRDVDINAAGKRITLRFPERVSHLGLWGCIPFEASHPICKAIERFLAAKEKLDADVCRVERETLAILNSVTTEKKLLEVWPNAAKYLPAKAEVNLPAIRAEDLDKTLAECKKEKSA